MYDDPITKDAFLAATGDERAAERFVAATRRSVRRLLVSLSSPGIADDLVQETYLRAFVALPRYAGQASAGWWLLTIARRVAADHLRACRRRPVQVYGDEWFEAHAHTPDHGRTVVLWELVRQLTPERRNAFVLTQLGGLSYVDAARACGCAVGTIRSRVARARDDLRNALGALRDPSAVDEAVEHQREGEVEAVVAFARGEFGGVAGGVGEGLGG